MKIKSLFIMFVIFTGMISKDISVAQEVNFEVPKVISFDVSRKSVEIASSDRTLAFSLSVTHSIGVTSEQTTLWFNHRSEPFRLFTDLKVKKLTVKDGVSIVQFYGELTLPANTPSGLYDFYADPISGKALGQNLGIPTTTAIYPANFNSFRNGEKSIIVRVDGNLNLNSKTFVGPTYSSLTNISDDNPRTLFSPAPLIRVGEIYDPKKYFEMRVPELQLLIESLTSDKCIVEGNILEFKSMGTCTFRVYTKRNSDYLETSITLSVEVTGPRPKPVILLSPISNQNATDLPKNLKTFLVYNNFGDIAESISISPTICQPIGRESVRIFSGGTCTLTYQTISTNSYLSSDIYSVSFEITRTPQTISFTPPATANLSVKSLTLTATASSAGTIIFETTSTGICSITGSTLNLLKSGNCSITATQAGTSTLAPISATSTVMITGSLAPANKTVTCVMGKKSKKVSGANPKCPKGYKLKK